MPAANAEQLTAIISQRMLGIFDMPEGFPDIRFDWVTEEDLRERIRLEASAPGVWEMTGNRVLSEISLKAEVHKYAPHELSSGTMTGKLQMGNHAFPFTYRFPGPFQFSIELPRVPMEHLINPVAPDAGLFRWLPALLLHNAKFSFSPQSGQFSLSAKSDDVWTVPVGRDGISLRQIDLDLDRKSTGQDSTGRISGVATIGGNQVVLSAPVDTPSVLLASCKSFDLPAAIDAVCDDVPLTNTEKIIKPLVGANLQVNLADQSFTATGSPPDSGPIRTTVYRHNGRWGFVAIPTVLRSWRISNLAPYLRTLDRIDISKLSLVVTSFDQVPWDVPGLTHELTGQLQRGTNLIIPTRLSGLPEFDLLARLYGNSEIEMTLVGDLNSERLKVQGKLPTLQIAPGINLDQPQITLTQSKHGEPEVTLDGPVSLRVDRDVLNLTGRLRLTGQKGTLSGRLDQPWKMPLGISGITVHRLNLGGTLDENSRMSVTMAGRASLHNKSGSVRVVPFAHPDYEVRFGFDHIPTQELLQALVPNHVSRFQAPTRSALESGFADIACRMTSNGNKAQFDFQLFNQRGRLAGSFDSEKGLDATGKIGAIRRQRITGGRHVLELTQPNQGDQGFDGPEVRFRPGHEEGAEIQLIANCTLFAEFAQTIEARLTKKGGEFQFQCDAGPAGFDLDCVLSDQDFSGRGSFSVQLQADLELLESKSGAMLGRIALNAPYHGELALQISSGRFEATLDGHLKWQNLKLDVPKLTIHETPSSFGEFRNAIISEIRPHAFGVFKPAFAENDAFHAAVQDGLLTTGRVLGVGAGPLALAMRQVFSPNPTQLAFGLHDLGYSSHDIATALKKVAKLSPDAAAKQLHSAQCSCTQIASALRAAYGAKPEVIAQSLRAIGFGHKPIAEAIRLGGGFKAHEAAKGLRAASFDAGEIALALNEQFHVPASVVAEALHQAGIKSLEAIRALPPVFETNRDETERLLIGAGYSVREVRGAAQKSSTFLASFW